MLQTYTNWKISIIYLSKVLGRGMYLYSKNAGIITTPAPWYLGEMAGLVADDGCTMRKGAACFRLIRDHDRNISSHQSSFELLFCAIGRYKQLQHPRILKMRLSGLQRDVLSLYRKCLRESRKKPAVSVMDIR
jgi:hypothetical protein